MRISIGLRHVPVAVALIVAILGQGTWALAGTTGGITGTVVDAQTHAPIAGVRITATAPSQSAITLTDAAGHFTFLSLTPDTYTVSGDKDQFTPASQAGVTVFADSMQTVSLAMQKALKTIAKVTSRAAGDLVRSGTTADVYSVNSALQDKISALGGGGSLNSAYSAVASVPGVVMPLNQAGYFQTVHIRGGDYDQVGYEFDGVPVNRSFDNFPSGQLSSLGMSELQVYTGATPANSEGQGLAGYINQVIKSGTFPGFGTISAGVGMPAYYHKFSIEVGGASPNRLFSYYLGVGGYDQGFRYIDQHNGLGYSDPYSGFGNVLVGLVPVNGCSDPSAVNFTECYANFTNTGTYAGPGGFLLAPYNWLSTASVTDRDVVANLHFGLPHRNDSGRDDVQILWDSTLLHTPSYEAVNDIPGGEAAFSPNSDDPGPVTYIDGYQWGGPVGTVLPANYSQLVSPYLFPASPAHTPNTLVVDPNMRDSTWNNQEIVKLQYQKNFGTNAYLRLYGYTYYSDWLQTDPVCAYLNFNCLLGPDYELNSHTRGVSATFADQLGPQHLLTIEGNYTTSSTLRDNNTQFYNGGGSRSMATVLVNANNPVSGLCYNAFDSSGNPLPAGSAAAAANCTLGAATYANWGCLQNFPVDGSSGNPQCNLAGMSWTPAQYALVNPANVGGYKCGSGPCAYFVDENSLYATYNTVVPKFTAFSIQDQYRPSERWLFNVGLRGDRFQFDGSATNPGDKARQFWFNAFNLDNCVQADGFTLVGATSPGVCPSGTTPAHLTNTSAQTFAYNILQPRLSGTYTAGRNTVLRFSAGEYVEPPSSAYEQYNTLQEDLADYLGSHFYKFGFTTPGHPVRPPVSYNYDFSWEQQFSGGWSFKLTPFYRKTKDQIQNFFLDQATGFVSGLNVGRQTSEGVEFQLQRGDFNANGLSGLLSLTYTHSYINYDTLPNGTSIVSQINNDIMTYNAFTSFCASHASDARCGGGATPTDPNTGAPVVAAPCFDNNGAPAACSSSTTANPYWNAPVRPLLDARANYATYDIFPGGIGGSADAFSVPYVATLVLNYKHDRFAITPSLQFEAGNRYGSPETTPGIDPNAGGCATNPTAVDPIRYPFGAPSGAAGFDAVNCNAVITIPNQYSGNFDQPGAFVNPNQLLVNLQLSYDASPNVTLIGTFANLVNRCWGGTKAAWTVNDPNVCSYGINNSAGIVFPVGNVFNPGATIQPFVRYPYELYVSPVNVDGFSTKMPFNFFLEARIKV